MHFWHDNCLIWDLHTNLNNLSTTTIVQLEDLSVILQEVSPFQDVDDDFVWLLDSPSNPILIDGLSLILQVI